MATYARTLLSGSTDGRPKKITTTGTPGDTVHTAVAGSSSWDEIYMWLTNTDSAARTVTVEFGGTSNPDDRIVNSFSLPANSAPYPVLTGQVLNNGTIVKVFASAANVVLATGYVNRIT